MKKTGVSYLLMTGVLLIVPGIVAAMDSAGSVSKPMAGLNALQSQSFQTLLAQAGMRRPALSDADKKMLDSQLQKFQGDYEKVKKSMSAQSLTDSLQQGNLNAANANQMRLNQRPTNRDRLVQ